MVHKQIARRPILVDWIYNDGDDGSSAFIERVLATPEEEERLRRRLLKLTDPSVDSRTRSAAIYDLRSEEHTSELQSQSNLVCRLLLEKKKTHQLTDTA